MCTAPCDAKDRVTFSEDVIIYKINSSINNYNKCVYSSVENTGADQAGSDVIGKRGYFPRYSRNESYGKQNSLILLTFETYTDEESGFP